MKKLTPTEQHTLNTLAKHGPYCPGTDSGGLVHVAIKAALDSLVKKKRATIEMSDDGPVYSVTAEGLADAL